MYVKKNWKVRLVGILPKQLQAAAGLTRVYRWIFGCWPNLLRPESFNEMVQARKAGSRDPRLPILADKHRVKDYVLEKLGADWIIPTLWAGETLPLPDARDWPKPFVIKANNGCNRNIFVRSDIDCDWAGIESRCAAWLTSIYGADHGEWLYSQIVPMIIVEPFISSDNELPLDYKFWTFHGRVEFIHVVTGREHDEKQAFFDRHWTRVAGNQGFTLETRDLPPPSSLEAMIDAAERLAADIDFVRVDLYEIDGRPLFGEMTFYPGSGLNPINPPEFDRQLVDLWKGRGASALVRAPMAGRTPSPSADAPY